MTSTRLLGALVTMIVSLTLGCGENHDAGDGDGHDHSGHDHGTDEDSETEDAFAELTAQDRKLAKAQKICPVSDEELGSMGAPIKVSVEGGDVFICCEGCRKRLLANPQKYLAKLKGDSK